MLPTLLSTLALTCLAADDAPNADLKKLEGTWTMVSCEQEGKKLSEAELKIQQLEKQSSGELILKPVELGKISNDD